VSKIDDGGTAYPYREADGSGQYRDHFGMTLRDYFAAAALPSIIAKDDGKTEWYDQDGGKRTLEKGFVMKGDKFTRLETAAERCACEAYEIAEAMLEARKEGA
jgi:hypothetical protein